MKFTLILILCSYVAGECLAPYSYPQQFNDQYDCFHMVVPPQRLPLEVF